MFYKISCSALSNTVMKYLNFRNNHSKLESVTWSSLKIVVHDRCFSKNFTVSAKQRCRNMYLDGGFWGQLYFVNFPEWLLLKDSLKDILEILSYTFLHFLLRHHVKEKQIFMDFFWVKVSTKSVSIQK